jgi:hypothetical protein
MNVYIGPLVGGPDDGNIVEASKPIIPVMSTTELFLDGEGKDITLIESKGNYVWEPDNNHFIWVRHEVKGFIKKIEYV